VTSDLLLILDINMRTNPFHFVIQIICTLYVGACSFYANCDISLLSGKYMFLQFISKDIFLLVLFVTERKSFTSIVERLN